MAMDPKQTCDLFVTCVDKIGPLLKIWGQSDRQTSTHIEQVLLDMLPIFEQQNFVVPISSLRQGLICCAKYKDGIYYRAQIRSLKTHIPGAVEVRFIDYGNIEIIQLENIRLFNEQCLRLGSIKPQASEYILAGAMHVNNDWDEQSIAFVHHEIAYTEHKTIIVHANLNYKLVKVIFTQIDLATFLICKGICMAVPIQTQELILQSIPQQIIKQPVNFPQLQPMQIQPPSVLTYKPAVLPLNSEHLVYVSYVEDGPFLFSIQLQAMEESLNKLMHEINELHLLPLNEPPLPGSPCMARCEEDNTICRAVVLNLVGNKCKTYYVDFGNTDLLPFSNIYQIPPNCMLPKVMSMRFTLAGLTKIKNVSNDMKCSFKEFVTNKLLKLKVVKEGEFEIIQYCELYDENGTNVLDILLNLPVEYKSLQLIQGANHNVIVSYIEGCKKFFVQRKDCAESLNSLMLALASTSETSPTLEINDLKPGASCCAFYSGDNQWYRARILSVDGGTILVKYVDYGNEENVQLNLLKKISPQFVNIIPAQAIECCLYGYQNMSFNSEIENIFESLTLECEFTLKVINKQSNNILLVDLFDNSHNNVAALLIEKLAAQKSQIVLPSQQIANKIVNDETYNQISTGPTSPRDAPPRSDRNNWRNSEKTVERQQSWRSDNAEDKKSWRNSEEKSWRNTSSASPSEEKPNKYQNTKKTNNENNRKVSHKKRREKWNDQGASGDAWNNSYKKRNDRRDKTDSWEDKKPFQRSDSRPQKSWDDKPTNDFSDRKSWDNDSNNRKDGWGGKPKNSWNEEKPYQKKDWKDDRKPREFKPRESKYGRLNSQEWDENSSDKSYGSKKGKSFSPKKDYSSPKREIPKNPEPLTDLSEPFKVSNFEIGSNDNIAVSWFYNPENFFCQILSHETEFKTMMTEIQIAYSNHKKPVSGPIPIGSSVIAEFSEDNILYRAMVLENKGSKYKVQYIDFGNMSLVDSNKIYQVETRFMTLPVQSVRCGIAGIKPVSESWPVNEQIDKIFNKDSFVCVFENILEDKYGVQLWNGDVNVKAQVIETGLGQEGSAFKMDGKPTDINLLIGQNIRIIVSCIYSLERFFIQLNKTKIVEIEEAINTCVQNPAALQVMTADMIQPEINCLLKSEDKWFRGIILDNTKLEAIAVQCPDTGRQFEVDSKNLYVLPNDLCIYWYQAFECTLHNLTNDSCRLLTDEKFKSDYERKEFIMYMNTVENGVPLLTLYDTNGEKLQLFEPDEDAFPTVDKVCTLPIFTSELTVYVSHINTSCSIYIQQASDALILADLLEKMFEFYEENGDPAELEQYNLCCAKSSDGNWYRARIEEIMDDCTKVLYIDYGNGEEIPNKNLKQLIEQFYEPPEFALHVSMNLTEISEGFKDKLSEMTVDKELKCSIHFTDVWIVELFDGENNINQIMCESGLAQTMVEPVLCICPAKPKEERRSAILITHIDSPGEFYVQLKANENDIAMLQEDLQDKIETLPNLEGAELGSLCAAKYTVDELWYRAEVLDADSDITTVRFVDFGNTDVIDNTANNLKTLSSELLAVGKYAKKCSLNISPKSKTEEWSQEACDIFITEIEKHEYTLFADIVYQDEKNKHYVELYDQNDKNVAQLLLDGGFAEHITRDIEDNIANNTGFVSHLNTLSEFWIQLESSVPDLEMIVERMAGVDSFPDLQDLSPGMLCAANYPEDEQWYRARILSNTVAGIEVLFIDYGNSSNALKIKELPEELIHMPALAQKCCLNKPALVVQWTDEATEKFREISEDGATVFNVKKLAPGETAVVELFSNGENIVDQLIPVCGDGNITTTEIEEPRPAPIGKPEYVKGFINHIESLDKFWVSKESDQETLDDIMIKVDDAETFEPLTEVETGELCATFEESTNIWYRAKIVSPTEVQLIDYGNIIPASNLRILPEELQNIPPVSFICSLELPKQEWSSKALENFLDINAQVNNEYEIEFLNNETPKKVRIYCEGENVCEKLLRGEDVLQEDSKTDTITQIEETSTQMAAENEIYETEEAQINESTTDTEIIEEKETTEIIEEQETTEIIEEQETTEINDPTSEGTENVQVTANDLINKITSQDTQEIEQLVTDENNINEEQLANEIEDPKTNEVDTTEPKTKEYTPSKGSEHTQEIIDDKLISEETHNGTDETNNTVETSEVLEENQTATPDLETVSKLEDLKVVTNEKESSLNGILETEKKDAEYLRSSDEVIKFVDDNMFFKQGMVAEFITDQNLSSNIQEMTELHDFSSKNDFNVYREEFYVTDSSSQIDVDEHIELLNCNLLKPNFETTDFDQLSDNTWENSLDGELCESFSNLSLQDDYLNNASNTFCMSPKTKKLIEDEKLEKYIYEKHPSKQSTSENKTISKCNLDSSKFEFSTVLQNEKIESSSISRCKIEIDVTENAQKSPEFLSPPSQNLNDVSDSEISLNHSFISKEEKIVPGSISRGDLQVPGDLITYSKTPHEEKIVPGSICRGIFLLNIKPVVLNFENEPDNTTDENNLLILDDPTSADSLENLNFETTKILKAVFPCIQDFDSSIDLEISDEDISVYKTPCDKKIVPGSISTGVELGFQKEPELGYRELEISTGIENSVGCNVPYEENFLPDYISGCVESGSLMKPKLGDREIENSAGIENSEMPYEEIILPDYISGSVELGNLMEPELGDHEIEISIDIENSVGYNTPYDETILSDSISGCVKLGSLIEPELDDREIEISIGVENSIGYEKPYEEIILPGHISGSVELGILMEPKVGDHEIEISTGIENSVGYSMPYEEKNLPASISECVELGSPMKSELDDRKIEISTGIENSIGYKTPHDEIILPGSISGCVESGSLMKFDLDDIEISTRIENSVGYKTPRDEKILPGSISGCVELGSSTVLGNQKIDIFSDGNSNGFKTPHDEKILPGSFSDCLELDSFIEPELGTQENDFFSIDRENSIGSKTPHEEKIVPGSISRGIELFTGIKNVGCKTPREEKIVAGSISRGILQEFDPSLDQNKNLVTDILYPVTPFEEKIVPGCISRGVTNIFVEDSYSEIILNKVNYEKTAKSEKIVPGSISRGYLEASDFEKSHVISIKSQTFEENDESVLDKIENMKILGPEIKTNAEYFRLEKFKLE